MAFVEQARDAFDYLVRDFDFLGPHVETGRAYLSLAYTGRHVGVRVEFDAREETVDVVLARLIDGTWPERFERGWVHADSIAKVRGVPLEGGVFRLPQSEDDINRRIAEEARVLRQAARDILEGDGSQLEQFQRRRREVPPST